MTDLEWSDYLAYDKIFYHLQQESKQRQFGEENKRFCRIVDIRISVVLCYDVSVIFLQSDPIKLRTVSLEYVEEIIFESHYVAVISLRRQLLVDAAGMV